MAVGDDDDLDGDDNWYTGTQVLDITTRDYDDYHSDDEDSMAAEKNSDTIMAHSVLLLRGGADDDQDTGQDANVLEPTFFTDILKKQPVAIL